MTARLVVGLALVASMVADTIAVADDPLKSRIHSTLSGAGTTKEGEGDRQAGISSAELLIVDYRASACFGVIQDPGSKARYSYLMVLKADPGDGDHRPAARFTTRTENLDADCAMEVMRGEKPIWRYTYRRRTDPMTSLSTSESITVGDKEFQLKKPTVFLVDLTAEKPTIVVTEIAAPDGAPGFDSDDRIAEVIASLVKLRNESKQVREFLGYEKQP